MYCSVLSLHRHILCPWCHLACVLQCASSTPTYTRNASIATISPAAVAAAATVVVAVVVVAATTDILEEEDNYHLHNHH